MHTGFEIARLALRHWFFLAATGAAAAAAWMQWRHRQDYVKERRRDRRIRQELEAYARLDARMPPSGDARELGLRVCRLVAEKSAFPRVAMLTRAADGRLSIAASAGMDDWTIAALDGWCGQVMKMQFPARSRVWDRDDAGERRSGTSHFTIELGVTRDLIEGAPAQSTAIPFWSMTGRMVGALVVCPRHATGRRRGVLLADALPPLEALSVRLARSLENVALAERLLRAEKLAGLGQLAGGVAHALNNPLTAVLGFAELIAETAEEPRVRKDAVTIVREALSMRETVQGLMHFWRPAARNDAAVAMGPLLRELEAACEAKLAARGVGLTLQVDDHTPEIRGNAERLREVMEHLLNNAAQAIQMAQALEHERGGDEIRITVSHDECALHVIVSDTGPGFEEPGRAFDPFYTTQQPGEGSGMGLSICYGIVREHGGEISAFNLHPHGAAVVVELPVGTVVREAQPRGESVLVETAERV